MPRKVIAAALAAVLVGGVLLSGSAAADAAPTRTYRTTVRLSHSNKAAVSPGQPVILKLAATSQGTHRTGQVSVRETSGASSRVVKVTLRNGIATLTVRSAATTSYRFTVPAAKIKPGRAAAASIQYTVAVAVDARPTPAASVDCSQVTSVALYVPAGLAVVGEGTLSCTVKIRNALASEAEVSYDSTPIKLSTYGPEAFFYPMAFGTSWQRSPGEVDKIHVTIPGSSTHRSLDTVLTGVRWVADPPRPTMAFEPWHPGETRVLLDLTPASGTTISYEIDGFDNLLVATGGDTGARVTVSIPLPAVMLDNPTDPSKWGDEVTPGVMVGYGVDGIDTGVRAYAMVQGIKIAPVLAAGMS